MKGTLHSVDLVSLLILLVGTTACNASQLSGTYVAHGATFAEMLQLTQTPDGQLSGVLSHVELKTDGSVSSEQTPVSGTADAGQLTLKFPHHSVFYTWQEPCWNGWWKRNSPSDRGF